MNLKPFEMASEFHRVFDDRAPQTPTPSYNIFKVFISYIEAGNLINLCYFFMVFPHIF